MDVPKILFGQRVIFHNDKKSFTLPNVTKAIREQLDQQYTRYQIGDRWYLPYTFKLNIDGLEPVFTNCHSVYIIGKGPSLDAICVDDFKDHYSPVICINESIHKIESLQLSNYLLMLQQDIGLGNLAPKYAMPIVSITASEHYNPDITTIYRPEDFGCTSQTLTAVIAIKIAKKFGINNFIFYCFDSMVGGELDYAKCIGKSPKESGNIDRFLNQRPILLDELKDSTYSFRSVKNPITEVY